MNTLTHNKNGTLTRYALSLGYVEAWTMDGSDYYGTNADGVALSMPSPGGSVYDVRYRLGGVPDRDQFDSLTEARAFFRRTRRLIEN